MNKALRVLICENSDRDREILERHLTTAGYHLMTDCVANASGLKAALGSTEWDIILCDYSMQGFNAPSALKILQASSLDIPFIIISGSIREETAVEALLGGANDYIPKENLTRLIPAIERELQEAENRRAQRRSEDERKIISEIIQGITTAPELNDFLHVVHRSISKILYAENCFVMLHDPASGYNRFEFWVDKHDPHPDPHLPDKGFTNYVMNSGQPLLLSKENRKQIINKGYAEQIGSYSPSWIGVPLLTPSSALGVMVLQHYEMEDAYNPRDLEFLVSVADHIALAIERKQSVKMLVESEERYRELVENAIDIIYTHDLEGHYTSVNSAVERITGYTRAEALSMEATQLIAPDNVEKANQMLIKKLSGQDVTAYEIDIISKDGKRLTLDINTRIIYENGTAVGVQGIARDITERKLEERARLAFERKYQDIFRMAPVGIYQSRLDGTLLTLNSALADLLGYDSVEELLAINLADVYFTDDEREYLVKQYKDVGYVIDLEIQWKKKDGAPIWIQLTCHTTSSADGEEEYFEGFVRDVTESRRAKNVMRRQAEIFSQSFDAVIVWEWNGPIIFWNAGAEELYKIKSEEAVGQISHNLLSTAHNGELSSINSNLLAEGHFEAELQHSTGDGRKIVVESRMKLIRDDAGDYVIETNRDITERKRIDEALRESDEKFHQLADNITDAFWIRTADMSKVLFISRAFEKIWGRPVDELYDKPESWVDFIHPDDQKWVARTFAELSGEQQRLEIKYRIIRPNSDIRWIKTRAFPVKNTDGELIRYAGIVSDITEERRADEALRESEEKYRTILENIEDGYFEVDAAGSFTFFNDSICQTFGYSRQEMMGKNNRDYMDEQNAKKVFQTFNEVFRTGKPAKGIDWEINRKDGSRRIIEASVTRRDDVNGKPIGFRGLVRDITERRDLEDRFRQSQKMEAIGVLAGGIAHDFNNLLTAINGYSDLVLRQLNADDPIKGQITEIKNAGDRAAALTGQLLAFSRKQILKPRVHNLNSVISEIEKMLRRIIRENIELRTKLAPDLGNIKADPGQIEQVIMNLAVNARDAMPGGGMLVIQTENYYLGEDYVSQNLAVTPGDFVRISVTDTGEGMDEETQRRIFDPFFTTKEVGKGTGLGLSTVYGIVKQSGGDIMVYSELGKGTTFKIYLPCVDEQIQRPKWAGDAEEDLSGTETILLVEDEDIVRHLVYEILTSNGYKVLVAGTGAAAIEIAENYTKEIHLLLTDVIMPKMGGTELQKTLSAFKPDIKVLFMSGYTDDAISQSGVLNTGTAFIEKPFTPDKLARKVRELLSA